MARKRVNTKFLVGLTTVFGVLLIGGLVAGWWYKESPGRAIARAQEAEERGDWEKAAEQWGKAAVLENGDPQFQLKAIDAKLRLTSTPDGAEWLRRINQNYAALLVADPTLMPALRGQMRLLAESPQFAAPVLTSSTREVRRLAGEVLKQEPQDAEAKTLHAVATINLSQFDGEQIPAAAVEEAEQALREVAQGNPGDGLAVRALVQRRLNEARDALQEQNVDAAMEQWQDVAAFLDTVAQKVGEPGEEATLDEATLHRRIGEMFRRAQQFHAAIEGLRIEQAGTPREEIDFQALLETGPAREAGEKADHHLTLARNALDEADKFEDDYYLNRVGYADMLAFRDKDEEAEQELRALVELRPWDAQASVALARFLQQQGQVEAALQVMQASQEQEKQELPELGGHTGVNARLARLLAKPTLVDLLLARRSQVSDTTQREKLLAQARATFNEYESGRVARGIGASGDILRIQGQLELAEGDPTKALNSLRQALGQTSELRDRLKVLTLLVQANRALDQSGAVAQYMQELDDLTGNRNPAVLKDVAEAHIAAGNSEQAREAVDKLLEMDPDNPVYQQLSLQATPADEQEAAYAALGEASVEEKQVKLNAAIRSSQNDEALRLARALREQLLAEKPADDDAQAQQRWEGALRGTNLILAQRLMAAGDQEQAIALLEPLAETDDAARRLLAQVRGGEEALIAELPEGPDKLVAEARQAEREGDIETALAKLEEVARLEPDNTAIRTTLFNAYLSTGDQENKDKAAALIPTLKSADADNMGGRSYEIRLRIAEAKDPTAAVAQATALANEFPDVAEALFLQAKALQVAERHDEAIGAYRRVLDLSPTNLAALTGIMDALDRAGRDREVSEYLETALRVAPRNANIRATKLAYDLQFGNADLVIAVRRQAMEENPESLDARTDYIRVLAIASRNAEPAKQQEYRQQALDAAVEGAAQFPESVELLSAVLDLAAFGGEAAMAKVEPVFEKAVAGAEAPLADNPQATLVAADYWTRRGNLTKAESIVRNALNRVGDQRESRARLLLGLSELAQRQGRLDEAVSVLGGFEDLDVVLARKVELLAARANANPGDESAYQALRSTADAAMTEDRLNAAAINILAATEIQRRDWDRAARLLEQAGAKDAADATRGRTLYLQSLVTSRRPQDDFDQRMAALERAASVLNQALELNPSDTGALRELASVQLQRGRGEDVISTLARLTRVAPSDVPARIDLVNMLLSASPPRYPEAAAQFREAESAGVGDDLRLLVRRSQMEMQRGRQDDALAVAQKAVEVAGETPAAPDVQNNQLSLLLQAGRHQQVLDITAPRLTQEGGAPWWVLRARGEALIKLGQRDQAIAAYTEAFAKAEQAGAQDRVLVDMNRQLGLDPTYALIRDKVEPADASAAAEPRYLVLAAALFAAQDQTDRAIELLEQALEKVTAGGDNLRPGQIAGIRSQLGSLYLQATPRRVDEAEQAFRQVLQVAPNDVGALNNLAYTLTLQAEERGGQAGQEKLAEAVKMARQAHEIDRRRAEGRGGQPNATILDTYGWASASLALAEGDDRQLREAVRLLREARGLAETSDSRFPEIYLHLSTALAGLKDASAAQEAAQAGLSFVEQERQANQEVDSSVELRLQEALRQAQELNAAAAGQ